MSRLRPPSVSSNRSQFLQSQNLPKPSSNPISINKVIKQAELSSSIVPSKPPFKTQLNSKNFNQSIDKLENSIKNSKNSINKTVEKKSVDDRIKECDILPSTSRGTTDILDLIKRRLDALKHLQIKNAIMEAKFYEELYLLECKYNKMIKPIKELRRQIVIGEHEPSDDECKISKIGSSGDNVNISKALNDELEREREISKDLLALSISNHCAKKGDYVKGLPEFWLSVLKRVGLISQMIEKHDEHVLKYLYDIDIDLQDKKPYNFTLKFYFYPNEYFTNEVLIKTYEFKIELDTNDPYVFEAPETVCSRGCKINWKKNKNVTRKLNILDPREDDRQLSFFNFFDTNDFENKNRNSLTCDEEAELAIDYEIGYTFKEKVIPKAILYYMGEINDEDNEEDDDMNPSYLDEYEDDDEAKISQAEALCSTKKC